MLTPRNCGHLAFCVASSHTIAIEALQAMTEHCSRAICSCMPGLIPLRRFEDALVAIGHSQTYAFSLDTRSARVSNDVGS